MGHVGYVLSIRMDVPGQRAELKPYTLLPYKHIVIFKLFLQFLLSHFKYQTPKDQTETSNTGTLSC